MYVARMENVSAPWQVSQSGVRAELQAHVAPMAWSRDGGTLYFADAAGRLNAVTVAEGPPVRIGRAAVVSGAPSNIIDIDVAPGGRLLLLCDESPAQAPLELIEHWTALASPAR